MTPRRLSFLFTGLLLAGCAITHGAGHNRLQKAMTAQEYCAWSQTSAYPFRDTQAVNNVLFVLEYQPAELEAARLLRGKRITEAEAGTLVSEGKRNLHFLLTIITPEAGKDLYHYALKSGQNSEQRAAYYAFDFKRDIHLLSASDSLLPSGYLHERGMANVPVAKFNLDFSDAALNKTDALTIYDKSFHQNTITFPVKSWGALNVPDLQIP